MLAIIFTAIEFDDIVLGIALNLEDAQNVAPTEFNIPREYIVVFALAPLVMFVFVVRKEVTTVDPVED